MDTDNTKEILDRIEKILTEHLVPSCDKMSNHINTSKNLCIISFIDLIIAD